MVLRVNDSRLTETFGGSQPNRSTSSPQTCPTASIASGVHTGISTSGVWFTRGSSQAGSPKLPATASQSSNVSYRFHAQIPTAVGTPGAPGSASNAAVAGVADLAVDERVEAGFVSHPFESSTPIGCQARSQGTSLKVAEREPIVAQYDFPRGAGDRPTSQLGPEIAQPAQGDGPFAAFPDVPTVTLAIHVKRLRRGVDGPGWASCAAGPGSPGSGTHGYPCDVRPVLRPPRRGGQPRTPNTRPDPGEA